MSINIHNTSENERKFMSELNIELTKTPKNDKVVIHLWKWQIKYLLNARIIIPAQKSSKGLGRLFEPKHWTFLDGARPNTRIEERKYQSFVW